jgi:CBS domain-containing protein
MVQSDPLAERLGSLMREVDVIGPHDSLGRAARILRESPFGVAVYMGASGIEGVITEAGILEAISASGDPNRPASEAIAADFAAISPMATGFEALRLFREMGPRELIVVDPDGRPIGVVTPTDLISKPQEPVWPGLVGGMATPFGIYLTNGAIRAGAGDFALIVTGMLLFTLFFGCSVASESLLGTMGGRIPDSLLEPISYGLPTLMFLVGIRLLPLAGIHAAEHQVVHAIERGEPLVPEVVARMPRVHPRCGTNLATGLGLFFAISKSPWIPVEELRVLLGIVVSLVLWRPLGNFVQQFITTRKANRRQLQLGIDAGSELLEKFRTTRIVSVSPWRRLWASGMLHIIAGSSICLGIVELVAWVFDWQVPL